MSDVAGEDSHQCELTPIFSLRPDGPHMTYLDQHGRVVTMRLRAAQLACMQTVRCKVRLKTKKGCPEDSPFCQTVRRNG